MNSAAASNIFGFNVTIPHKEAILPLLDKIDPTAAAIGAVNTLKLVDGSWVGYNTDASGFLHTLNLKTWFEAKDKTITVVGAGGAARAVVYALADAGARQINIVNRSLDRAESLATALKSIHSNVSFTAYRLREPINGAFLRTTDLLVNCTSRGLADSPPLDVEWPQLSDASIVADIVYFKNGSGMFLDSATRHGKQTFAGLWMLLGQAERAFTLWTGKGFDIDEAAAFLGSESI